MTDPLLARSFALILGLSLATACGRDASDSAPPAVQALTDPALTFVVESLAPTNLPPAAVEALEREVPHVVGEVVPASSLQPRRRGVPAELVAWEFPLRLPARSVADVGALRWEGRTVRHMDPAAKFVPPYWTVDSGRGVLVLAAGETAPTGDLAVDYALDVAELGRFDAAVEAPDPTTFTRRSLTVGEHTWSAFYLPAPASAFVDVVLPEDAQLWMDLGLRSIGAAVGDGAVLEVLDDERLLATLTVAPGAAVRSERVDLARLGPGPARLRFRTRPGSGAADPVGDYVFVGDPRIVTSRSTQPADTPRNLVFVLVDTLRADHMSSAGYERETSPRMDAHAATGVHFRRAQAQSSWTRPAMASIFTGLLPSQHGVLRVDATHRLGASFETLAERFRAAGFQTVSLVNNPQLGPEFGLGQGFGELVSTGRYADDLVDEAIAWIDANGAAPYFLYLHVADPHDPYRAHPAFDFLPDYEGRAYDLVDDLIEGKLEFAQRAAGRFHLEELEVPYKDVTEDELAKMIALYDGEIAFTDRELGRLFDHLEATGQAEDTLVVLTSDHGEEFGEHGGYFHGYTLHREVLEVPLYFTGPGVQPGLVRDEPVTHVDLLPTLLELFALDPPALRVGRSYAASLRGGPAPELAPIVQETGFRVPHKVAWTEGDTKSILQTAQDTLRVYDLANDPDEHADLAAEREAHARAMRTRLRDWLETQTLLHERLGGSEAGGVELDADLQRRLAEIGYGWGE